MSKDFEEPPSISQLIGINGKLAKQLRQLQAQLATAKAQNQSFGNVLAVIHRDGGHYITKHGHEKASKDAIKIVLDLRKESDHE